MLIVEDHSTIRNLLRSLFETQDLEVTDASNGAEGVAKAQEVNPGLIVLDLSMPVMNGFDAARALKQLMPHVPLLMFTNHIGAAIDAEARSAGVFAVISKSDPNSSEQLLLHARALLNRQDKSPSGGNDAAVA